jgi:tRNA-specific 2-thiouridylase
MSGGTDSSVAAIMLLEQGFDILGLTLRTWSQTDPVNATNEPDYLLKARNLAGHLGFPHTILDVRQEFRQQVIQYFIDGYLNGITPNPCAKCNPELKWKFINQQAELLGYPFIASGHYVDKEWHNQRAYITKGLDPEKEQSFFLWGLNQTVLQKAIFPLAKLSKSKVRQIAIKNGFQKIARQKESIGICFLNQPDYRLFLAEILNEMQILIEPGWFVDGNGKKIGQHTGYVNYTVGQRRGLGLNPKIPWYVTQIDPINNLVVLGNFNNLYRTTIFANEYHVINPDDFNDWVDVRVRYRKQNARGKVHFTNENQLVVELQNPEWSIAPGQTVAFYQQNRLLGGGFISSSS